MLCWNLKVTRGSMLILGYHRDDGKKRLRRYLQSLYKVTRLCRDRRHCCVAECLQTNSRSHWLSTKCLSKTVFLPHPIFTVLFTLLSRMHYYNHYYQICVLSLFQVSFDNCNIFQYKHLSIHRNSAHLDLLLRSNFHNCYNYNLYSEKS